MPTFKKFRGINNVLPSERLADDELSVATDVDIGLSGEVSRRAGYTQDSEDCHKNIFELPVGMLATSSSDLVYVAPHGTRTVLQAALGMQRVWYSKLPDGRVTFANGLICGITDGSTVTSWGVPLPTSVGNLTDIAGALFPGDYQWGLTYVRLSDGLEGGAFPCNGAVSVQNGGVMLMGLPAMDGYKINVYLSSLNDDALYLAGSTTGTSFVFTSKNDTLTLPCRTEYLEPAPTTATVSALWRSRTLVADGPVLKASLPYRHELFDPRRDYKQFTSNITLIQPVDDGVYVGTETELAFLAGTEFDKLVYRQVINGPVVLGSGVAVLGERIKPPGREQPGSGPAMLCIADRRIVAGFSGGVIGEMTVGRYETDVTEVAATFRELSGVPQYIAIPQ